ncbi:MAG: hypothetical protein L0K86_21800, partial [Actinomycetia bacterium]|nr:hypothetical protein [Actinomycetes bacterium]
AASTSTTTATRRIMGRDRTAPTRHSPLWLPIASNAVDDDTERIEAGALGARHIGQLIEIGEPDGAQYLRSHLWSVHHRYAGAGELSSVADVTVAWLANVYPSEAEAFAKVGEINKRLTVHLRAEEMVTVRRRQPSVPESVQCEPWRGVGDGDGGGEQ